MENGTIVYSSWKDQTLPDTFQPWPETGFLTTYEADPPGETSICWFADRESAIESLGLSDEPKQKLLSGYCHVDLTPEGSIGNYGIGVYAVEEAPEWVNKLPEYLGWDGSTTAEQRAEEPV